MKRRPTIGATGVMSADDTRAIIKTYGEAWRPLLEATGRFEPTHDIMIGALAGLKTLRGNTNKYPLRYPKREDIAACFPACSSCDGRGIKVFTPANSALADDTRIACPECSPGPRFRRVNLVHYATGGVTDPYELADDLDIAMQWGGPRCDGLQVNASWPSALALGVFRQRHPDARLVLQLGPGALSLMQYRPRAIAERVRDDYGDVVTDVLVDVSGGRGLAVNADQREALSNLLQDLAAHGTWTIGMAGGLCAEALSDPETMPGWRKLLLSGCSIDAEGRLRDDAEGGGNLVLDKVSAYLRAAIALCGSR